ncbi:hypothetical protein QZH41_006988 [Actinostola sp. cb2023]|nr:hypothetical protein QZH41_006988 [Actinostola sp. cb2023]
MSNATNQSSYIHLRNYEPWYGYIFAGLYIVVIIVALFGNLLVCVVIGLSTKLRRSPTNLFVFSLALSDLITAILAMPFDAEILITSGIWYHGEHMCKAWTVAYLLAVPSSILTFLALSVDRYKTLSDPLNRFRRSRFMTRKRALTVIFVMWAYCFALAILPVSGAITTLPFVWENQCFFPLPTEYSTISTFVNFVLPIVLTCAIYIKIYQIAKLHPQQQQKFSAGTYGRPKMQKDYLRNIRAAKTISMFVCAFVLCWVPYCSMTIVSNLCTSCFYAIPPHVYPPLLMLGYLNSALNPFLFSFRNRSFKGTFMRLYSTLKKRKSGHSMSRSINSLAKRSELPDTDSGTVVRMFSMRSFSIISRSETTPESNPNELLANDLHKNDIIETCGSREPLNTNDRLHQTLNWSMQFEHNIDIAASLNSDNTYL